jgi:hypothetical protein
VDCAGFIANALGRDHATVFTPALARCPMPEPQDRKTETESSSCCALSLDTLRGFLLMGLEISAKSAGCPRSIGLSAGEAAAGQPVCDPVDG